MYAPSFVFSSLKIGKGRLLSRDQIMTNLYPWWCVVPLEQTNIPRTVSYLTEIITWRKGPRNKIKLINLFAFDEIKFSVKIDPTSFILYRIDYSDNMWLKILVLLSTIKVSIIIYLFLSSKKKNLPNFLFDPWNCQVAAISFPFTLPSMLTAIGMLFL